MMTFQELYATHANNTEWHPARQRGWRAGRVIWVKSATAVDQYIVAAMGVPGVQLVRYRDRDFAWADGVFTSPNSEEGAKITARLAWENHPPPFQPEAAIVWIGESPATSRRYLVNWPIGTPYNPLKVWVKDIT